MPYIGNTPALDYISFAVQNFTVTAATTVYTLDYSVSNENDIALYINSVAQRPGSSFAYSATGTTLTLTSATLATDTMYAVFIGRAVQTVTPAAGSVTNTMLSPSVITGQTAETSIAGGDSVLIFDDSASALRKMTRTNFVSGLDNTPAFMAFNDGSTTQAAANSTGVEVTIFNTELFDSNSAFNTTTGRFTPQVAGKYFFTASIYLTSNPVVVNFSYIIIGKNNSFSLNSTNEVGFIDRNSLSTITVNGILTMNGTTDFASVQFQQQSGGSINIGGASGASLTFFGGYRLIGV